MTAHSVWPAAVRGEPPRRPRPPSSRTRPFAARTTPRRLLPTLVRLAITLVLSLTAVGCTTVPAWQRGKLASPAMRARFVEAGFAGDYRKKTVESTMGGGVPGDAPGGGCGCTQ